MDRAQELACKHARVRDYLDAHDLDVVALSRRGNFSWYTGGARNYVNAAAEVGNSTLLIDRQGAAVLTTNIEATRLAAEELAQTGIEVVSYPYHDAAARSAALARACGGARAAADAAPPWMDLPLLDDDFTRLRWTLTPAEIARYRALAADVVAAVEATARAAAPGQTEHALAAALAGRLRAAGALPWVLLVAADDRIARHRHPLPAGRAVTKRAMLVCCAERGGLIAACTRLVSFEAVGEGLAARHRAVVTVDAALIAATRPGATLGAIFAEAQEAYRTVGFADEWRRHHQGGSCGYAPREVIATGGERTAALADQAFAWNPSIAGTKSEDTILCTDAGPQPLAAATDWPTIAAEWKGLTLRRPDILELR
jgi:antitoxin VapB